MDGNNRWSKKKNLTKLNGYEHGVKNLLKLTEYIFKCTTTNYISAFALSQNNLNRSKNLINTLKIILNNFLDKELDTNTCLNFNIRFIGDRNFLNSKINNKMNKIENLKKKSKKFLIIYINYSGKKDIFQASKKYFYNSKKNNKNINFSNFLLTSNYPEPDILIRTGGFKRISDFLLYQISFTEFYFTKKLWPDLNKKDLSNIFNKFYVTERKFGL